MSPRGISVSCDHCTEEKVQGEDGQLHCPNQCTPVVIEVVSTSDAQTELSFDEMENLLHQGAHNLAWDK